MISISDTIKYIGIAAIVYFLIKAFARDSLSNLQILVLVVLIMILVIFISCQNVNCPHKNRIEL